MAGIRVELQLADGSFTTGMLRAGQSVSQFRKELARVDPHFRKMSQGGQRVEQSVRRADVAGRGFLQTFRDISVIAGATTLAFRALTGASGGFVGEIIKVNAEMERLQYQMQGMSVSSNPIREAATSVEWLRQKATEAPFSLNQMANSFVKLKATGVDPMAKSLQAVMDGIAAFGGTDEHLHRVTLGIVQMSGKSVIQMEEMRQQLGESMPNAMRLMARSMGVSVAELTKAISTGRVESGAALDAFYNELERTYGGEAQRMMETFSGQVSQLKANLQILATGDGLKSFFDEQKSALQDLNEFLQTDQAQEFAKNLGEGLRDAVRFIRRASEAIYDMRKEIVFVAKVIAVGIGVKVLASSVTKAALAFNFAKLAIAGFGTGMASSASAMRLGVTGLISGQHAATSFGLAMTGARGAVVGLGGALAVAAPWLVIIGGALSLAASKMSLMGESTDEAYESLVRYGAESKEQAEGILAEREQELARALEVAKRFHDVDYERVNNMSEDRRRRWLIEPVQQRRYNEGRDNYAAALEAWEEFQAGKSAILSEAQETEGDMTVDRYKRNLRAEMRVFNEGYRQRQVQLDRNRDLELASMSESGREAFEINQEFQEQKVENERRLLDEQLGFIDERIAAEQALADAETDEDDRVSIGRKINFLLSERVRIAEQIRNIGQFGISFVEDIENEESKIKRGGKLLDGLQSKIKGIQAELAGAGNAYARLQFEIARGDYGSVEQGGETVRRLHEALVDATLQKEALDELMEGRDGLESDLARAERRALERSMDLDAKLAGADRTDGEKIAHRLSQGFYTGLGSITNIREDIQELIGTTNVQGETMNEVGRIMRENAFGQSTVDRINTVRDAIQGVTDAAGGMAAASVNAGRAGFNGIRPGSAGNFDPSRIPQEMIQGIIDAANELEIDPVDLATVISYETAGTFDPTKTGPATQWGQHRGLIQFGEPQAERFGVDWNDPINSQLGADGAIVKYLRESGFQNGMSILDLYSTINAGAPGLHGRTDENNGGAAGTVEEKVAGMGDHRARAETLFSRQTSVPVFDPVEIERTAVAATQDAYERAAAVTIVEQHNQDKESQLALQEMLNKLTAQTQGAEFRSEGFGKNYASVIQAIEQGNFGAGKSIDDEEFREILRVAQELDDVETRITDQRKARREATADLERLDQQSAEINREIAEQTRLAADPNYRRQSDDLRRLNVELNEYVEKVRLAYGQDSQEYARAIDQRQRLLGEQGRLEAVTRQAELTKEAEDLRRGLLTQGELRQENLRRDIRRVNQWVTQARAAGLAEVDIVRQSEEMKALVRDKYREETNPVAGQMREWKDLSKNLMDQTTGWMDNLADGITGLITGTGDLQGAVNSMLSGIVNSYVKYFISQIGGQKATAGASKLGSAGAKAGGGSKVGAAASVATGGKGKLAGVAHTGGIAGGNLNMRRASASMFANAPKFHTGGIAGMINTGPKLTGSEVPIIAKRNEGIFTPEQMSALAPVGSGMGSVQINAPITVNGSAGTPEQNDDLSKKMAREMEGSMRGVVVDEIRKQMRPGNMMSRRR